MGHKPETGAMKTLLLWLVVYCLFGGVACQKEPSGQSQEERNVEARRRGEFRGKTMIDQAELCEKKKEQNYPEACFKACELGHSNSCANVASYELGKRNRAEGVKYSELACQGGSGIGCELFGDLRSDAESLSMARIHHRVHCEQGYRRSCEDLATMFEEGKGGKMDQNTARHFKNVARRLGSEK